MDLLNKIFPMGIISKKEKILNKADRLRVAVSLCPKSLIQK